jgi:hypothetical protein
MRSGWPDYDSELQPRVFSHLEKGPYGWVGKEIV